MSSHRFIRWAVVLFASAAAAVCIAWGSARWREGQLRARLATASLPELERAAEQRPWDPAVWRWMGARSMDRGDYQEAVRAYSRRVALEPRSGAAAAALGYAFAKAGRVELAKQQLERAIGLDPRLGMPHYVLGVMYVTQRQWEPAVVELQAASTLDPNNLDAQYQLAQAYGHVYLEDKKMEILERLVKRAPTDIRYLKSLGYVYLFFGRFADGEALYRRILSMAPDDQETHYLLGRALAEQANTPEGFAAAERELKPVEARAPGQPGVHVALGILYFRRDQPAKAITELERAIQAGTGEEKTLLYLGQAYMRVGRTAEGRSTLARFRNESAMRRQISQLQNRVATSAEDTPERKRDRNEARLRLARAFIQDHQFDNAESQLRVLLDQEPKNAEVRQLLRRCESGSVSPAPSVPLANKPEIAP